MVLEQLDIHMQNKSYTKSYTQINSRWQRTKCNEKLEIFQMKKKIVCDPELRKDFLIMTSQV